MAFHGGTPQLSKPSFDPPHKVTPGELPIEVVGLRCRRVTVFPDHAVLALRLGEKIDGSFEIGPEILHALHRKSVVENPIDKKLMNATLIAEDTDRRILIPVHNGPHDVGQEIAKLPVFILDLRAAINPEMDGVDNRSLCVECLDTMDAKLPADLELEGISRLLLHIGIACAIGHEKNSRLNPSKSHFLKRSV